MFEIATTLIKSPPCFKSMAGIFCDIFANSGWPSGKNGPQREVSWHISELSLTWVGSTLKTGLQQDFVVNVDRITVLRFHSVL